VDPPATSYLDRDGAALAYQVVGAGPVDVVLYLEISQHLDLAWTDPHLHYLVEHMTTYARSINLQPRGFGLSEPVAYTATIEQQADDILAGAPRAARAAVRLGDAWQRRVHST
jgi:hypothetical protein